MQEIIAFFSQKGAKTLKNISPFLPLAQKRRRIMRSAVWGQGVVAHLRPE